MRAAAKALALGAVLLGCLVPAGCMVFRGEPPPDTLPPRPRGRKPFEATYSLTHVIRVAEGEEQRLRIAPSPVDAAFPRQLASAFLATGWFASFQPSLVPGEVHFDLELQVDVDPANTIGATGTLLDLLLLPVHLLWMTLPHTTDASFRLLASARSPSGSAEVDYRDEYTVLMTWLVLPLSPFYLGDIDYEEDALHALARAVVGTAVERGVLPLR